ncbi:MAG: FAD-binding protein [Candidatus Helarchaeota archaeon]
MSNKIGLFLETINLEVSRTGNMFLIDISSKDQIPKLLKFANAEKIPIFFNYTNELNTKHQPKNVPFLFLSLGNFTKIHEINITNRYVEIDPGIKAKKLNNILEKDNFCFSPFYKESEDLNIGQMLFGNYIGKNRIQTVDSVLGLEVILPSGEIINTGSKTLKSVSGYDITSLYIGSQGIFGIILKSVLKIDPIINYPLEEKEHYIQEGFNKGELSIIQKLKKLIDPNNILNPTFLI